MARATCIADAAACANTRLAIAHGKKRDPHLTYLRQLVADFYSLWAESPAMRSDILKHWKEFSDFPDLSDCLFVV